ncbi:MAG: hypothetical protein ACLSA6_13470 [Holdemania massiliensis]
MPWVLPSPIQLALATLDWAVAVWILLIALDVILYLPFVKCTTNSC